MQNYEPNRIEFCEFLKLNDTLKYFRIQVEINKKQGVLHFKIPRRRKFENKIRKKETKKRRRRNPRWVRKPAATIFSL